MSLPHTACFRWWYISGISFLSRNIEGSKSFNWLHCPRTHSKMCCILSKTRHAIGFTFYYFDSFNSFDAHRARLSSISPAFTSFRYFVRSLSEVMPWCDIARVRECHFVTMPPARVRVSCNAHLHISMVSLWLSSLRIASWLQYSIAFTTPPTSFLSLPLHASVTAISLQFSASITSIRHF